MSIDKAITYLKKKAPKGEFLAYINPKEAAMLKKAGGSGELVNGIPSYRSKAGMESKARSRSYSSRSKSPSRSPRGPQELGTSTRTQNRITAPAATTRIGGKTYNVTPETRGDRDRATLKQQLMRQPFVGNRIDRFGNTKKPFFPQGSGGIGQLLASLIGFATGIPGLGLAFSKKGMNFINEKFRGTNPDGSIRTQAEYEQSMYDKRQQNRVAKLLEAKNRGFNQIGFGDFTAKTVDFTPNQQALLDNLIAQGYGPASVDAANPTFQNDLGNPNMDLSGIETIQQLAQPNINAFPGMGVAPNPVQQQFFENVPYQAPDFYSNAMADASAPGNNFLYNTGNPYKDNLYDSEGNYDPYGIKGEPEPEVREIKMAFAPNSKRDRALKNLYSGYENLGIKDPQMIDLMQQDLLENKEKGTPLSLPQSAYTLVG